MCVFVFVYCWGQSDDTIRLLIDECNCYRFCSCKCFFLVIVIVVLAVNVAAALVE